MTIRVRRRRQPVERSTEPPAELRACWARIRAHGRARLEHAAAGGKAFPFESPAAARHDREGVRLRLEAGELQEQEREIERRTGCGFWGRR